MQDAGLPVYDVKPGFDFQAVVKDFVKDKDPDLIEKMRGIKLRDFRAMGQAGQVGQFFGQILAVLTDDYVHGVTPEWLEQPGDRPRIGVTLGTVAPKMQGLTEVERVLAVAPKVDAEFVLALGDTDLSALGELPPNVRPVGWVPLNALLDTCAGVIHHGGAGTMLTAAAAGIPQVILPNGADRYINADAAQAAGAAVSVQDEELEPHVVERLLTDDKLVHAAHTLRDEINALPAPAALVANLESLV